MQSQYILVSKDTRNDMELMLHVYENLRICHIRLVDVQSLYKRIVPLDSFPILRSLITWVKENVLLKDFFSDFKFLSRLFSGSTSECTPTYEHG